MATALTKVTLHGISYAMGWSEHKFQPQELFLQMLIKTTSYSCLLKPHTSYKYNLQYQESCTIASVTIYGQCCYILSASIALRKKCLRPKV